MGSLQSQTPPRKEMGLVQSVSQDRFITFRSDSEKEESSNIMSTKEKCYDPTDTTLKFVDGYDDMDFECMDYKSLRARMSCGHTVTPMSLTRWSRMLLDEGKSKLVCGHCDVEWPYEEVRKMALLTPEETEYFEKKQFENTSKDYMDIKKCPGCKSYVMRTDLHNLRVCCSLCTADNNATYDFCWQCLREWKGPSPHSDRCAYDDCSNKSLQILKTCPEIIFEDVTGVTGCPCIRACPTCGFLVEHNRTKCKNIVCSRCRKEFCFVCLKLTAECLKTCYNFSPCSSGVAPRQTSIPVWKR